ncbi:MAG: phosphoglycerate kinase [Nanoarchaeota archaeon]|nr:phosphoglycerate kinase [Nanoarchaeota archaeon]
MKIRTLSDFNLRNKRVLLRLDLNTEIIKGKAQLSERMKAHQITLNELKKKKAITVILAHQSRPGEKDFTSLKQHAKLIKVKFVPDIIGEKAINAIKSLKPGEVLLLDNIRNLKEEFDGTENNNLVRTLAPLFNIYINDAFSVSHREQTSVTGFPKVLPCGMGRVMEAEVKSLENINLKNTLYILGGAKPKENIDVLKNSKNVLTCGVFGQLCTIAKGANLGAQNVFLKNKIKEFVPLLKPLVKEIQTPIDFAVNINGKRKDLPLKEFPSQYEIFDIGPQTQKLYVEKIKQAKSIFMKGVAGYCEDKQFQQGTKAILQAIAKSKAFSVVGGGHTTDAISKLHINKKKFGYISLSGGALDEYVAGKKLPGLEVLRKSKKK